MFTMFMALGLRKGNGYPAWRQRIRETKAAGIGLTTEVVSAEE